MHRTRVSRTYRREERKGTYHGRGIEQRDVVARRANGVHEIEDRACTEENAARGDVAGYRHLRVRFMQQDLRSALHQRQRARGANGRLISTQVPYNRLQRTNERINKRTTTPLHGVWQSRSKAQEKRGG